MRGRIALHRACLLAVIASYVLLECGDVDGQGSLEVRNASEIRMAVAQDDPRSLRVTLPGQSATSIVVVFPEHVTARRARGSDSVQLYLSRSTSAIPSWRQVGNSLEYQMTLPVGVTMMARATLEPDGILYRYEFANHSDVSYDMIYAVTDPRLSSPYLRDVRLERTYVHHKDGFELLASEDPERLSEPLERWLPNRYRVSYSWPVEREHAMKQGDGITWYNKSRPVDEPFIATKSTDGRWIAATFSYDPGNVWSNPELTCQHADPQISLRPGQSAAYEVKTLIVATDLTDVLDRVREQRPKLAH